ncbi:MAG TPA: NAD(P)/FAD-dependent oxidoreductase [Streptosporangiaceae bacterium]|jgi:2-polyprenyl-6-methoxyphenol hydroxylase-like FAD-dependent oxidoreductase
MNTTQRPQRPLKVLIAGGGIGGLCLAHGLRRAGIDVTVLERTLARADWLQGYRIHINPDGNHALRTCLPPENWKLYLDSVADGEGSFAFVTPTLAPLLDLPRELVDHGADDPVDQHHGVSRIGLRAALLDGLDDVVQYGRTFERYTLTGDGRVTAHLSDGGEVTGDLLVGADGAGSRVRGQFLPHLDRIDTGVVIVAGKYPLTDERRARLPRILTTRANNVIPTGRGGLFTAVWEPDSTAPKDAEPYTFWGYSDAAERMPVDGLDGAALARMIGERLTGWSPHLREMVTNADPETVNAIRVLSAPPRAEPWPSGPVTLMGDAIHSMTPMAGIGANTALRDAETLSGLLNEVAAGRRDLHDAVAAYEDRMRDYGFAAVRLSLRNAQQSATGTPLSRHAFRTFLRTANAIPPIKRHLFANQGRGADKTTR